MDRSDLSMAKRKMKKDDTKKMKMKTAEHIELDRRDQTKRKMKNVDTTADHNELKRSTQLKEVDKGMIAAACNLAKRSGIVTKANFEAHHEWKRRDSESSKATMTYKAQHQLKRGVRVSQGSMTYGEEISA